MDNSNNSNTPSNPTIPTNPPVNPMPDLTNQTPTSAPTPAEPLSSTPTWPPAAPAVQADISFPASPWAPSQPNPAPSVTPAAQNTPSPLDNPWGAPSHPPPLGGLNQQTPTTQPEITQPFPNPVQTPPPTQPSWMASSTPTPSNTESAPTDLSQLIASQPSETTPLSTPETLQVSQSNTLPPEVPTLPQEHKGIPKWLIGIGIGLLILVLGASAYFILGIGQQKTTTSLPAVTQQTTVKTPPPIASPIPQPTSPAEATGSSSFGQLGGSGGTQTATRAGDLMKKASPTPSL